MFSLKLNRFKNFAVERLCKKIHKIPLEKYKKLNLRDFVSHWKNHFYFTDHFYTFDK